MTIRGSRRGVISGRSYSRHPSSEAIRCRAGGIRKQVRVRSQFLRDMLFSVLVPLLRMGQSNACSSLVNFKAQNVEITKAPALAAGTTESIPWIGQTAPLPAYCRVEGVMNRRTVLCGEGRRERETPSLSLRLRSVKAVRGLSNAARTKSNSIRVRSNCVRFSFETDMSHLNCHLRLLNARRRQPLFV